MNDLSRHLMEAGSHAHLPFHAACPGCRGERLAGTLHSAPVIPPRAAAGFAAAVLATSAVPVTALSAPAVAAEDDQGADGAGEPGPSAPAVDGLLPGEGSGANTPLGEERSAAGVGAGDRGAPAQDEPGPIEQIAPDPDDDPPPDPAPTNGLAGSAPGTHADSGGGSRRGKGTGSGSESVRGGAERDGSDANPAARAGGGDGGGASAERRTAARVRGAGRHHAADSQQRRSPEAPRPHVEGGGYGAPVGGEDPAPVSGAAGATLASPDSGAGAATKGSRFHVVRPGESLWSIAADVLGKGAGSADIAREVNRIWVINADAIGTGNPDLLMVGQRLRLR